MQARIRSFITLTTFCFVFGSAGLAGAQIHDAAADFSLAGNPNGAWSYGWSATPGGAFNAFDNTLNPDQFDLERWNATGKDFYLAAAYNPNGSAVGPGCATDWCVDAGKMTLHPGPNDEHAVLRFTAPEGGRYQLDVTFSFVDQQARTVDVFVLQDDATILDTVMGSASGGYGDEESVSAEVVLCAGAILDIVVGDGVDNYADDGVQVDAVLEKLGNDAVCVLEEECPCDGGWRNHGKYVSCVAHVAKDLRNDGTLNEDDEDGVVSDAARSDCGR